MKNKTKKKKKNEQSIHIETVTMKLKKYETHCVPCATGKSLKQQDSKDNGEQCCSEQVDGQNSEHVPLISENMKYLCITSRLLDYTLESGSCPLPSDEKS